MDHGNLPLKQHESNNMPYTIFHRRSHSLPPCWDAGVVFSISLPCNITLHDIIFISLHFYQNILSKKRNAHFVNDLTFCVTQQLGAGKLHSEQDALNIVIVYALDHIRTARHELRHLHENDSEFTGDWIKSRILMFVNTCKLAITETLHSPKNNVLWPCLVSLSTPAKWQCACLRAGEDGRRFNVTHTEILLLRHCLQETWTPGTIHVVGNLW